MRASTKAIMAVASILASSASWGGDFASCILDKMPEVKNGPTFAAVQRACAEEYPDRLFGIKRGAGLGLFGPKNADACIIKHAANTTFQPAAASIGAACNCLYSTPSFKGEMCAHPSEMYR